MRNIQPLTIEIYRVSRILSPPVMNDIFTQKDNHLYNSKQMFEFARPLVKSVCHGSESTSFLGAKIWSMPPDCKDINPLSTFKNKVKK